MSFGGHVSAMISSLNRNKRNRKTIFDDKGRNIKQKNNLNNIPKREASKRELDKIKSKLSLYNSEEKRLVFWSMMAALVVLGYFLIRLFGEKF